MSLSFVAARESICVGMLQMTRLLGLFGKDSDDFNVNWELRSGHPGVNTWRNKDQAYVCWVVSSELCWMED